MTSSNEGTAVFGLLCSIWCHPLIRRVRGAPVTPRSILLCLVIPLLGLFNANTAADEVTPFPKKIERGEIVGRLNLEADEFDVWRVEIPEGARNFVIKTWGGRGDCDVLQKAGTHPTRQSFDRWSIGLKNNERIVVAEPTPGANYVALWAHTKVRGLAVSITYQLTHRADDLPKFTPSSAVFAGFGRVVIHKPAPVPGVMRYTMDGTDPTATSPIAGGPIWIITETELRARFFPQTGLPGPVARANYSTILPGTVTTLESGVPIQHLAGGRGSTAYFKFTALGGLDVVIQASGGSGNTRLLARYGQLPTGSRYQKAANGIANQATLRLPAAKAGDWYIALQGLSPFRHCTLFYTARSGADLVVWPDLIAPQIWMETFTSGMCEVDEKMITEGTHRIIRFTTESRNVGTGDVSLPSPEGNPLFEFQQCHGHYHFKGFARYRLVDLSGNVVAVGSKVSYCLADGFKWDSKASGGKFDCSKQGITAGWSDVYDAGLPGQWVVIDNVPPGDYRLEITTNPDHVIPESNYDNNTTTVPVNIPPVSSALSYEIPQGTRHYLSGLTSGRGTRRHWIQ